jgi:hypothetical protein
MILNGNWAKISILKHPAIQLYKKHEQQGSPDALVYSTESSMGHEWNVKTWGSKKFNLTVVLMMMMMIIIIIIIIIIISLSGK